jgi:hypothetical protein
MNDEVEQPSAPVEHQPASLDEIFNDLQGFGLEECDEIITIASGPKNLRIRFSNISTVEDLTSHLAAEEKKGYEHFQTIKAEILSRAITWVNGVDLRKLEGSARLVTDPRSKQRRDFQTVMRDTILGWGSEVMQLLWKALMVHIQKIEDRLFESLPIATVMTDVERRYLDRLEKEIEAQTQDVLRDRIEQLVDGDGTEDAPEETTAS